MFFSCVIQSHFSCIRAITKLCNFITKGLYTKLTRLILCIPKIILFDIPNYSVYRDIKHIIHVNYRSINTTVFEFAQERHIYISLPLLKWSCSNDEELDWPVWAILGETSMEKN